MRKHSLTLKGHPTSITLEDEFWRVLKTIAKSRGMSIAALVDEIDESRLKTKNPNGLSSALRIYILGWVIENCLPLESGDLSN
jgi:predicted DNA-binding ribbon-helix-helix protein